MSFQRGGGVTELWKSETFSWNSSPSSLLTLPSSFIWVKEARKEGEGHRHVTSPVGPCMCGVITNKKGESMRGGVCSTVLLPLRQRQIPKTVLLFSCITQSANSHLHNYTDKRSFHLYSSYFLLLKLSKTSFHRQVLFLFTKTHISTRFQSCWIIKYL